ncbi:hypothetical protein IAU60_000823 [Kwoniella sp. DSM 27419]
MPQRFRQTHSFSSSAQTSSEHLDLDFNAEIASLEDRVNGLTSNVTDLLRSIGNVAEEHDQSQNDSFSPTAAVYGWVEQHTTSHSSLAYASVDMGPTLDHPYVHRIEDIRTGDSTVLRRFVIANPDPYPSSRRASFSTVDSDDYSTETLSLYAERVAGPGTIYGDIRVADHDDQGCETENDAPYGSNESGVESVRRFQGVYGTGDDDHVLVASRGKNARQVTFRSTFINKFKRLLEPRSVKKPEEPRMQYDHSVWCRFCLDLDAQAGVTHSGTSSRPTSLNGHSLCPQCAHRLCQSYDDCSRCGSAPSGVKFGLAQSWSMAMPRQRRASHEDSSQRPRSWRPRSLPAAFGDALRRVRT